ncbi:MAG: tetratricopeptide repeat protein [Cyanobacteria bacterium P01_F01_bin.150]
MKQFDVRPQVVWSKLVIPLSSMVTILLIIVIVSLSSIQAATAQVVKTIDPVAAETRTAEVSTNVALPSTLLSQQDRNELEELRTEKRLQQLIDQSMSRSPQFQDRIEFEVDRAFERTTTLLNILLVILTSIPLFVALGIWLLRRSVVSELVTEVRSQAEKEVLAELKIQQSISIQEIETIKAAALTQLTELSSDSRMILDELKLQINIAEQEIEALKSQVTLQMQRMVTDAQVVKDQTIQELTGILPMSIQGSIPPDIQPRVGMLTTFLDTLKSAVPQLTFTASDYSKQGYGFFFESRYEEAIALYDKALEIDPDLYDASLGKAATLLVLQQYEEALISYDRAISLREDSFEAWFGKGAVLRKLEHYEEAIATYDRAATIKTDSPLVFYNKGLSLIDLNQYDSAIEAFQNAIQLKPDFQKAWVNQSLALRKVKRYPEADAACLKAIQLNSEDSDTRYAQACCDALQNRLDEAIENLELAVQNGSGIIERAKHEDDLENLRSDRRFQALLEGKSRVGATRPHDSPKADPPPK